MAAAGFSLRVATDHDGRLMELCLSSPTGSPRRSPQRPLRPALKPAAAPPRRVQWAARNQVHTFSSSEAEEPEEQEQDEMQPQATAAGHSGCTRSGRQHCATQPGSPGWHSPPQAAAMPAAAPSYGGRPQSAAYSVPATQQHAQQPYWDAAAAAAAYYQQYGWGAYQHPMAGQPAAPAVHAQEAPQQSQPQPQPQMQQSVPAARKQGSTEHDSSTPCSPSHLQVHAGSVHITIDSPEVKLQGMRGTAGSTAAAPASVAPTGEQQALLAKPAACSAGTQTDPSPEAAPVRVPASGSTQQAQLATAGQSSLPPHPQALAMRQPLAEELPPGIPAGPPPQQPWRQEQQQERQQQGPSAAASVPPLRIAPRPAATAGSAPPAAQQEMAAAGAGAGFDGDVSSWGRLQAGDSYWDGEGLTTGGSLSSGLSPRESRPRQQEWDHAEAMERLADQATAYGHAMRLQLQGRGAVSATAALPARLAAQQLASLAGMSRKVQEALLHSQVVFQRQASVVEQAVLARAFWAWRHLHASQQQRRAAALAARRRIDLGQLRRCLHAWRGQCGRHEARAALLQRAAVRLRHGLMQRCWREWRRLVALRAWKVQVDARDQQIQLLCQQLRHMESRPVRYMARWRLRTLLVAWQAEARRRLAKRQVWQAAEQRRRRSVLAAGLGGWQAIAAEAAAHRRVLQRAARLLGRLRQRQVLAAWRSAVVDEAAWREQVAAAKQLRRRHLELRAFHSWRYIAWFGRTAVAAQERRRVATLAAVLAVWRRRSAAKAATAVLLSELQAARQARLTGLAFGAWATFKEGCQARRQDEKLSRLAEAMQRLGAENEQLKRENERLARVIDSGDWSRQRVQELLEAGQVLQAERDALQKLLGAAAAGGPAAALSSGCGGGSSGYGGAELLGQQAPPLGDATNSPEVTPAAARSPSLAGSGDYEGGVLQRYHVSTAGIQPGGAAGGGSAISADWGSIAGSGRQGINSSRPTSPAARNKLLVKSGSSFNAMVRALKQDLVTSGVLARGTGPAALYEVDKLSLNRLTVAADGQVEVEAVSSPDRRGVAFGTSYPSSPKRQTLGPAAAAPRERAGVLTTGLLPESGGAAAAEATAAPPGSARHRQGGSGGLLAAALRLQGIGGRSVGLRGSRG